MLLYVVCKGQDIENNPDQKQNVHMNLITSRNMLILLEIYCMMICLVDIYA